jgi:hypothetical protein
MSSDCSVSSKHEIPNFTRHKKETKELQELIFSSNLIAVGRDEKGDRRWSDWYNGPAGSELADNKTSRPILLDYWYQ